MSSSIVLSGGRYRPRWARTLSCWDVEAKPGEVVHLVAPNGAGKSTFLRAAVGLVPARWDRRVLGPPSWTRGAVRFAASTSGVPASLRVADHVALLASGLALSASELAAATERWDLGGLGRRWGDELSVGQHQCVQLAVILAGRPAVVVLDEPTVGLDDDRHACFVQVADELRRGGAALLIASHDRSVRLLLEGAVIGDA